MCKLVKKIWYSISLQQKLLAFASIVTVVLVVSSFFNFKLVEFSIDGFSDILNDNARCGAFLEAMEGERDAFQTMMREGTGESRHAYEKAIQETKKSVLALPYSYQTIGSRRYARTWSIKNAYETYSILRDQLVSMGTSDPDYVERLYWIYDIQDYLVLYGNRLIQETLNQGNVSYQEKAGRFSALPYGLLIVSGIMLGVILWLTKVLSDTMVDPVLKLSESAARIESGDFSEEDVEIKNQDEMGQLVRNFNRMKHAMEEHIHTLQEKNEMSSRLHREEVERIETEKRLEAARMELLKSQINPHFLFNTLSMIACTAKLEEAETTEKMITSMSSLFRYNLKTSEQIVALKQELDVVQNYIYIQKMITIRAGSASTVAIINTSTGLDLMEISDLSCNGPSGTACIRACNLSPDLGPFDVALENRGNSYRTFTNVRFQEVTPFSSFASGWYSIYVFRTNAFNNNNAIAAASAALKTGGSYTLYMFNGPSSTDGLRTLILSN